MKSETDNSALYTEQHNSFDFKKFLFRVIRKWHWFVISIFISLLVAWSYNRFMPPVYNIHSSLIINEYESGIKSLSLSQNSEYQRSVNVLGQDHAGRLKSFMLSINTLDDLGWRISYFQKTPFYGKDLYGNEPFRIQLTPNKNNLLDVPVYISYLSDSEFQVDVDAKTKIGGITLHVKFSQKGVFSKPFENNYFAFTLDKVGGALVKDKKLYFTINNLNNLALEYQKKLKIVSNEKKPDLMELTLNVTNPSRGVDFLNRLEAVYVEYGLNEKNRVAENTMKFIDSQLKSVTDSLSYSENRFTNFRARTQAVDLNQESGLVMQKQEALESERAVLESRLEYLRNLRDKMNDKNQMKQVVVPSVYGITDQTLNNLVAKLSELYSKREVLSFSVQEKAPSLIVLDKEIQMNHNLLAQNINSLLSGTETELTNLMRRVGGFSSQLSLLPRTEQQLTSLKRSFDLNNELYTFLLKMRAESAITYASNQPDVKVLDPARIETAKQTSPMTLINYLVGILMGFFIPIFIIVLNDLISNKIQSKEEIEELTKLPIAGMIMHNKSKKDMVVFENPRSNISESFRLLRTNLKYILSGNDKKVLAVQSSISGEGKSFVAVNLATVLAMNSFKVLLVGVDMRMSNLHNILKSNNMRGLSTYLSDQDDFNSIVEITPIENLFYIASGPIPPNPSELLENGLFKRLINEAKSRYDFVVLDNPPVSLVADGIIAGHYADVNLFVVRFGYSLKEHLKFIKDHEVKRTLPSLALVLNDVVQESLGNGHYYNNRNKYYYEE